jgi:hypothetical protein
VTGLGEFSRVFLVPPPLLFVLALDELANFNITFTFPHSWADYVDVSHVSIAHHALDADLLLRGHILWSIGVLHLLWGEYGRVGAIEGLGLANGGRGGGRRRTWWEDLGLLWVHGGL